MSSWLSGGDKTRTNVRVYGDTTYTHLPPSIVVTLPAGRYSTLGTAQCVHSQCRAQGRSIELQGPQCLEDVVEHHGDDALATQLTCWCKLSSFTLFLSEKLGEVAGPSNEPTVGHRHHQVS